MSIEVTWNPRASIRARVRWNDAGENHRSCKCQGVSRRELRRDRRPPIGIHGNKKPSNQARFASNVLSPSKVTADFRCRQPVNRNAEHLVAVRLDDLRQLRNPSGVAASGEADEKFAVEAKNVHRPRRFRGGSHGRVYEKARELRQWSGLHGGAFRCLRER